MRKIVILVLLALLPLAVSASRNDGKWLQYKQPDGSVLTVRYCGDEHFTYYVTQDGRLMERGMDGFLRVISKDDLERAFSLARSSELTAAPRKSRIKTTWDPNKIYKSPVILVSFSDEQFIRENPVAFYDSLFNVAGFNQGVGPGCVADYFRDQSGGLFNTSYDIYGPVLMPDPYNCGNNGTGTYKTVLRNAFIKAVSSSAIDLSPYDWDGDGYVEQVIFISAGCGGNDSQAPRKGGINPHTSIFPVYEFNGMKANWYTCTAERWFNDKSCGIGTILHELSHALGLPDIYPTAGSEYSVVDEWDLMDGGNFTNWGWCPPNYSAQEKMIFGWMTPTELTDKISITDMKAVADGGPVYRISNTDKEYFLLENRQQKGWDVALPGKGLAVFHVYYDDRAWHVNNDGGTNSVNNISSKHRYDLVHADNMGYYASRTWVEATYRRQYLDSQEKLNSFILSGSVYPLITDTFEYRALTTTSTPAMTIYEGGEENNNVLNKPITNIQMTDNGLISFDFMDDSPVLDGVDTHTMDVEQTSVVYDLSGRRVKQTGRGLFLIRNRYGKIRKIFN